MRKLLRKLGGKEKGFTLVELMVVMAILAMLSAIVFPAVAGTGTQGRSTRQAADIKTMGEAVQRFNVDTGYWPTGASDGGAEDGTLPADALVTTAVEGSMIKSITFDKQYTNGGTTKKFVPDWLRTNPVYYNTAPDFTDADAVAAGTQVYTSGGTWKLDADDPPVADDFDSLWVLDSTGRVFAIKKAETY